LLNPGIKAGEVDFEDLLKATMSREKVKLIKTLTNKIK
jgi:flagellar basal body rod protein FlgB